LPHIGPKLRGPDFTDNQMPTLLHQHYPILRISLGLEWKQIVKGSWEEM